ncbi:hypothetical protein BJX64DRAFT_294601 [Aspergillus heterothallicus]
MADSPDRGFLASVASPAIQKCTYTSVSRFKEDFQHALDTAKVDYILLSNVAPQTFATCFNNVDEEDENPCARWRSYDPLLRLLLVQMPSKVHDCAGEAFNNYFVKALIGIGMFQTMLAWGTGRHSAPLGNKEADKAWGPIRGPPGRNMDWPTLVVETAFSETNSKLRSDVRYWERAVAGNVNLIITIRVARNHPEIIIEKWGTNAQGKAQLEQRLTITLVNGKPKVSPRAPMVFEFERVFLRPPTTPREQRNVVLRENDLKGIATQVWIIQEFLSR